MGLIVRICPINNIKPLIMKFRSLFILSVCITNLAFAQIPDSLKGDVAIIQKHLFAEYKGMFRPAAGSLVYPYITPGSDAYSHDLWDWDSWLSNIALRQILTDNGSEKDKAEARAYEQGCVLNYLTYTGFDGYMPILIPQKSDPLLMKPANIYKTNMHKPVIAQHAAFLTRINHGNAEWLREKFALMQAFITNYKTHHRNQATGLYYWQDDLAIGIDNDPSTFFRPAGSSASIFLNCLMYKELNAMVYLARCLKMDDTSAEYAKDAEELKAAIQKNCWDEKDGYFYSVDLNLRPVSDEPSVIFGQKFILHANYSRTYNGIIQRIGSWAGFMAMWAGIPAPLMRYTVYVHYQNSKKCIALGPVTIRQIG